MPLLLDIRSVTKRFPDGTVGLRDVSLSVAEGQTLALIGESGSGKSTLLRLLNRLDEPTSGEIFLGGKPIQAEDPVLLRRRIGYAQQDGGLLPHWTVSQNVELVPMLLGWDESRRRETIDTMLRLVKLDPVSISPRYPSELSGGQRQRVAIARALATNPAIVLLDEPFGAVDALTRRELQDQFLDVKTRIRSTVILVTHDLQEAFRLADRVAILRAGQILQIGPPDVLRNHPSHDYVRELLHHLP